MQQPITVPTFATAILIATSLPAMAYVGPGVGAGAIAVIVGVIGAIFLAIFSVVYYPIKRMLKAKAKGNAVDADKTDTQDKSPDA